MVSGTYQHRIM